MWILKGALIVGYYGHGNFGDEILMEETMSILRELGFKKMEVIYPRLEDKSQFRALEKLDMFRIIKGILKSDAIFFGGGGILQDETSLKSFVYYSSIAVLGIVLRKKVVFLGNSFGPIKRGISKCLMRFIARSKKVIFFPRDVVSERYLKRIAKNVRPGCDLAVGYLKEFDMKDRTRRAIVVPKSKRNWREITEFLRKLGLDPVFLLADPGDLKFVNSESESLMFGLAIESIASSSVVISERFHPALIASYYGVPFVAVGKKSSRYFRKYLPKYPGILENPEDIEIMLATEKTLSTEYDIKKSLCDDYMKMIRALSAIKF